MLYTMNICIFFIYGFISGQKTTKRGFVEGALIGSLLSLILLMISLIFFISSFSLSTFFYYLILIIITMIAATIGKNKKENANPQGKK